MIAEIRQQARHECNGGGGIAGIGGRPRAREPSLEIIGKASEETRFVRRIGNGSSIHRADAHGDAQTGFLVCAQLRAQLALVGSGAIAVIRMNSRGYAIRQHAGGRELGYGIGIEHTTPTAVADPRLEKIIVVAKLDLT